MPGSVTYSNDTPAEKPVAPADVNGPNLNILPADFYTPFFSEMAKNRTPDEIRELIPLEHRPGMISMLAGKPNSSTFPISSLQFTTRDPMNPSNEVLIKLTQEEVDMALQYNLTAGITGLCEWVYGLQERSHGRKKGEGWKVSIGAGSQDLIYKAVTALVNPGDPVFIEAPVYAGVLPMFRTLRCEIFEVETDAHGICSHSLRSTLENWPVGKPKPKVLYTVPYGCNPTGMTATLERRLEVLALCREHNFIILEDDPYYYLYYGSAPRPPSYFQLERDQPDVGRVLRFDSLSKILSSGMRVGFVSGPEPLVKAMDKHTDTANLQPSTLSQVLALAILKQWGYKGFMAHTKRVSEFYRGKRDVFEAALKRHLAGLAQWDTPEAGMFVWFKLLLSESNQDEHDSESVIRTKALERGVLALPGTVFLPNGRKTAYVRASFSVLGEQDVDEALRRLREAILDARAEKA